MSLDQGARIARDEPQPAFVLQYYFPYRTGNRATYVFDWKKELSINWNDVDWSVIPTNEVSSVTPSLCTNP